MTLKVQNSLFGKRLVDDEGNIVAKIKKTKPFSMARKIVDVNGQTQFIADVIKLAPTGESWNLANEVKYVLYKDNKAYIIANVAYARSPKRTKLNKILRDRPQTDKLTFKTDGEKWEFRLLEDNAVEILNNGTRVGKISPFFSLQPMKIDIFDKFDGAFWAGIYVLAEFMAKEEDLITL